MKIVLTGFMGTGKTSVGRELARKLRYSFVDTDKLIEEREGTAISLIFKEKGEEYFRSREEQTVAEVSRMSHVVIATGGGVIKNPANVENLGRRGIMIWLRADPEIILKRVMTEGGKRPLLEVEEPLREINKLLTQRVQLYRMADASVDTNYITPEETAQEIIELLGLDAEKVTVDLRERSYDIMIGSRILQRLGLRLKEFRPSQVAIISNTTIFPLYEETVMTSLKDQGFSPQVILLPDGEEYKNVMWAYHIHGELLAARFDRQSLLIAFGGGVVGDIAGYAASTYMRGVRYVQVPTTLLSQVDSSVGGKTGINHPLGKNMIGTFYQPSLVLIDVDTLRTLPSREFCAGMAEVIKYGVIADRQLFDNLVTERNSVIALGDGTVDMIRRSCEIKARVVSRDERESGLRAILNFGHTIGHAIETVTGYRRFLHGEAVAIGMCAAAEIAGRITGFSRKEAQEVKDLVALYQLPRKIPRDIAVTDLMKAMEIDKKAAQGRLQFVLPETIGRVRIERDVNRSVISRMLTESQSRA